MPIPYSLTTPPPIVAAFIHAPVQMPSPRALVEAETARLIDVLDTMDDDPDLEPSADPEPSLCGSGTHPGGDAQFGLFASTYEGDDREGDDADDPRGEQDNADMEPSLCGITACSLAPDPHGYHDGEEDAGNAPERTALESYGAGFRPSGDDDAEEGGDLEGLTDDNGIADTEGAGEQGFLYYGFDHNGAFSGGSGL